MSKPTIPVSTADLAFDLLEGLKRVWRNAGYERKSGDIAAGFARGTGGIDVEWLIQKLGPPAPLPPESRAAEMVREMRAQLAHWDYLLPGKCRDWPKPPMGRHWFFWRRPVRISFALETWAGEMARARSLMDLSAAADMLEAQGTEARRAETGNTDSVHDGPVPNGDAPK